MPRTELILDELGIAPRWVLRQVGQTVGKTPAAPSSIEQQPKNCGEQPLNEEAAAWTASGENRSVAGIGEAVEHRPLLADGCTASSGTAAEAPLNAATIPAEPATMISAAASVASLDWEALKARVADCAQCKLCERRTQTVFGVGDQLADWLFVGEAPGEQEDRQGQPFVGQAGKLLDNMLMALDLVRGRNVYIANVIKCRPPGNRNPELDEVARCEPYLQRQVALLQPKLIVAMGRFAAQSLLKSQASIASLRGRVHQYEGVPVIVTYHPAYLLRNPPDKAKAWSDLCLARATYRQSGG